MKILTLTRITKHYNEVKAGNYHILNPYSLKEISDTGFYDGNKWVTVTELLFKDGHTTLVKESSDVVKDLWRDSL